MTDAKPTPNDRQIRSSGITPPPELVTLWVESDEGGPDVLRRIATCAAQWGADMELEACCTVLDGLDYEQAISSAQLRVVRRPKPPSLKKRALEAMHRNWNPHNNDDFATIARALEQLPE